jgi:DNA-binding transcriptional MerR regulator
MRHRQRGDRHDENDTVIDTVVDSRKDAAMESQPEWTLPELVRRVGLALSDATRSGAYPGAPNGRVREFPDERAVRWYTTIGLVDRPLGGRGRGARYGPRHLRQVVAVKHLQAQGWPLAEIQARLTGAGDDALAELGPPLSAELLAGPVLAGPAVAAARPAAAATTRAREAIAAPRFWAAPPVLPVLPVPAPVSEPVSPLEVLTALRLAEGVTLLLSTAPDREGVAALVRASGPLLAALRERGLIPPADTPAGPADPSTPAPTEGAPR